MTSFIRSILLLLSLLLVGTVVAEDTKNDGMADARLLQACLNKSTDPVDEVKAALADGANINIHDKRSGQTPLMAAVLRGKVKTVRYLLKQGADVTIAEKDGYTPAHGAGFQGQVEVMKALKEHGVDILMDQHQDGFFPLHRACWGRKAGHVAVVEYLMQEGLDPNLESTSDGKRCIEMTKSKKIKKILLEKYGAEPSRFDDDEEL